MPPRLIRGLPEHRQSQPAHRHRTPLLPAALAEITWHRRRQFLQKELFRGRYFEFLPENPSQSCSSSAERYLGRTLSATDINTLLYFYDVLGFSTELIVYLIESCVSNNHTSIRYIEKVALGWADQHITTVEEASRVPRFLAKCTTP